MIFSDLAAIVSIDREIRETGTQVSYKDSATHHIFETNSEEVSPTKRPDILEIARLIELVFDAECEGTVCGFIFGRQVYLAASNIQQGEIALIAIHPHYTGKGIGARLVNSLCDLFLSRDIRRVEITVDQADKSMPTFLERSGFSGNRLLNYHKKL